MHNGSIHDACAPPTHPPPLPPPWCGVVVGLLPPSLWCGVGLGLLGWFPALSVWVCLWCTVTKIGCVWEEILVTVDGIGAAIRKKCALSQGFGLSGPGEQGGGVYQVYHMGFRASGFRGL